MLSLEQIEAICPTMDQTAGGKRIDGVASWDAWAGASRKAWSPSDSDRHLAS